MFIIRGRLTPEIGAVVRQALAAACDRMHAEAHVNAPGQYAPSAGQRQADALGMIAEAALRHDLDPGAPGSRYQVVVHVDAPVLADPDQPGQSALEDGGHVSAETSRRLACDASRVVMRHDAHGRVVEVGARTRTIPPAVRLALHAGPSHQALGERRAHDAVEPRAALPAPPPVRTRRRLSGGTTARRRARIPAAQWLGVPGGAGVTRSHGGRRTSPPRAECRR